MQSRRPTIADVAKEAGVSKGLVSFVFNDRPGVAAPTRERILAVADQLGWRPDLTARSLSARRSSALGLVVRRDPRVVAVDPFFPAFMAGVETVLARHDHVLVLSLVADAAAELRTYRTLAAEHRVDGVFLTDLRRSDVRLQLLAELGLAAVCIGRPDTPTRFPTVELDDDRGVRESVRHLVELGHRDIAHVAGDPGMLHGWRRRESFTAAMAASGLAGDRVVPTDFSAAAGVTATGRLLDEDPRPTALVYSSDPMAIAGVGVLHQRGLDVPGDVSVTGFDGADLGRHIHPTLTTVVADPLAWGQAAAATLLDLLAGGQPADVALPAARLLVGESTGPPP